MLSMENRGLAFEWKTTLLSAELSGIPEGVHTQFIQGPSDVPARHTRYSRRSCQTSDISYPGQRIHSTRIGEVVVQ